MYREPQPMPKPVKQVKQKRPRIKQVSEKRKHELAVYKKLKPIYMEEHPNCVRCGKKATDIHHGKGRAGKMLNIMYYWRAVCRPCHTWIETHPIDAIEQGLSDYRNK